MKTLLCALLVTYASLANAGVYCDHQNPDCNLYIDSNGVLQDRLQAGKIVSGKIGDEGILANVSIIKYQNGYAIIRESFTNDRVMLVVPLKWNGGDWMYDTAYMFGLSVTDSSSAIGKRWYGKKIKLHMSRIDGQIWERLYGDFSIAHPSPTVLSQWPNPFLKISTVNGKRKGEICALPRADRMDNLAVESIACRRFSKLSDHAQYEFSGVLGKYPISSMIIERQGNALSGCFRYAPHADTCIELRGEIYEDQFISLREFAGQGGCVSGTFRGRLSHGGLSGRWESSDSAKAFQFNLLLQGFPDD